MSANHLEGHPLVSIVTINYNQLKVTLEMLDSIRQQDYCNVEVIVVDNASKEDPTSVLQDSYPEVQVIRSECNLGFSGGNNLGLKVAKGDFIFLVNNDTELTVGLIDTLLKRFADNPDLGIVSPLICYEKKLNELDVIQYAGATAVTNLTARNQILGESELQQGQYTQPKDTAYIHGAAMMISRKVLEKVGGMPEVYFLYYEELDWSEQIRRAGYCIQVEPRALIYHKESVSTGKTSPMKTYYLTRNRILFMRRNRSSLQIAVFFLFFVLITMPRWVFTFAIKGEWSQLDAFIRAFSWHLTPHKSSIVTGPDYCSEPVLSPAKRNN